MGGTSSKGALLPLLLLLAVALLLGGGRRRLLGGLSSLLLQWQCSALMLLFGRYARLATGWGSGSATSWPAFRWAAAVPSPLPLLPEASF